MKKPGLSVVSKQEAYEQLFEAAKQLRTEVQ
jgi:hypothetical protein